MSLKILWCSRNMRFDVGRKSQVWLQHYWTTTDKMFPGPVRSLGGLPQRRVKVQTAIPQSWHLHRDWERHLRSLSSARTTLHSLQRGGKSSAQSLPLTESMFSFSDKICPPKKTRSRTALSTPIFHVSWVYCGSWSSIQPSARICCAESWDWNGEHPIVHPGEINSKNENTQSPLPTSGAAGYETSGGILMFRWYFLAYL